MGTPSLSTIRSEIVTQIKTAMNPGTPSAVTTVHAYRRFWRDAQKFQSLFLRPQSDLSGWRGLYNGWMISLKANEEEAKELFRFYTKYRFELEGFLGLQDATGASSKNQQDFIDQIETVRDNLRLNTTVFSNTEETTPVVQFELLEPVEIKEISAWHCLLSLEAESITTKFS